MIVDLSELGVTKESFVEAILTATGCGSREEAVNKLAGELGVKIPEPFQPSVISDGDTVQTSDGETQARVLTDSEVEILRQAAAIQTRLFG